MKRWVVALAAIIAISLMVSGITGCGAKPPTTSEYDQNDQQETKTTVTMEVIENDGSEVLAD